MRSWERSKWCSECWIQDSASAPKVRRELEDLRKRHEMALVIIGEMNEKVCVRQCHLPFLCSLLRFERRTIMFSMCLTSVEVTGAGKFSDWVIGNKPDLCVLLLTPQHVINLLNDKFSEAYRWSSDVCFNQQFVLIGTSIYGTHESLGLRE